MTPSYLESSSVSINDAVKLRLYMWRTDAMMLEGEHISTQRKTCPMGTLSTTNPTWIGLRLNPGLRGVRPASNRLSCRRLLLLLLRSFSPHFPHQSTTEPGYYFMVPASVAVQIATFKGTKASHCRPRTVCN
jgi:hypothetical protein